MRKSGQIGKFFLGLLLLSAAVTRADQVATSTDSPAASAADPVQACLDEIQKNKFGQNKANPNNQNLLPIHSHPLSDPEKNLPMSCLDGSLAEIKSALTNQINNGKGKSDSDLNATYQFGCRIVTKRDYCLNTNRKMLEIANAEGMTYAKFVERAARDFDWFESDGRPRDPSDETSKPPAIPPGKTQFTGYFNPTEMDASAVPTEEYKYAVYSAPKGLTNIEKPDAKIGCGADPVTGVMIQWCIKNADGSYSALPTREQIDKGALKGSELAYFKSPYDVQSIMLEGSGSVALKQKDGSVKDVVLNFAGTNGRPNNLLGSVVKCENKKISGSWKDYYTSRANEAYTDTIHYNPSIVFYKEGDSYIGTDDIPVTPNATLATDPKNSIPTGAVTLFNIPAAGGAPITVANKCKNFSTMAVAQDTGGAIRYAHNDIYRGTGDNAEMRANATNDPGSIYIAILKGAGKPVPHCHYQSQVAP